MQKFKILSKLTSLCTNIAGCKSLTITWTYFNSNIHISNLILLLFYVKQFLDLFYLISNRMSDQTSVFGKKYSNNIERALSRRTWQTYCEKILLFGKVYQVSMLFHLTRANSNPFGFQGSFKDLQRKSCVPCNRSCSNYWQLQI